MRWQVIAIALVASALSSSGRAADAAPAPAPTTDADLAQEADSSSSAQNVDAGTGKTLQERIRAVSRRSFLKANRFELTPHSGFSTSDPFTRSWVAGARGAWHFNEEFALDFGGAYAFYQQPLDIFEVLNAEISDDARASLSSTALIGYADIGVTFSPFYGKVALASELVGHFDVFVSAGAAAVFDTSAQLVHPGLEIGLGSRLYLTRWLAARVDVRNYAYATQNGNELALANLTMLNFGLAFYLPLEFDYAAETLGAKD